MRKRKFLQRFPPVQGFARFHRKRRALRWKRWHHRRRRRLVTELLKILEKDSRYSAADLASMLGESVETIEKTIEKLEKMMVVNPNIELQNQFGEFVLQVDKSKVVVQKALDEAKLLFDSLMQKYFG